MPTLVKRKEIMLYLDTTPSSNSESWKLYGKKSTSATYSYNPETTSETYIVDDNATVTLDSYNVTIDGNMKCYFGDEVYDFVNGLRYNLATGTEAVTKALLVDKYDASTVGGNTTFKAQVFEATISVESYGGDGGVTPNITFSIGLNGTPKQGSVTFTGDVPTFTEASNVSL